MRTRTKNTSAPLMMALFWQIIGLSPVLAQGDAITKTFTLTGQHPGPFNIGAVVQAKSVPTAMSSANKSGQPPTTAAADVAQPAAATAQADMFSRLFGMAESDHHNPAEAPHGGGTSAHVPSAQQPYPPGLTPGRQFPNTTNPFVCHNYVIEQLTGKPTINQAGAGDVTNICQNILRFIPTTYDPGHKDQLPTKFPPGTVLQFADHVGIVGADGKTVFNYTQPAPQYDVPGALNQNTAQDIWNKSYQQKPEPQSWVDRNILGAPPPASPGLVRPYANSPLRVWTPPK